MKHALITKRAGTSNYTRNVFHDGRRVEPDKVGRVLHAHFQGLKEDMESANGNMTITFSSCREAADFPDPDNASIPERTIVFVLLPMEDMTGDAVRDSLRLWTSLVWHGPHATPAVGDKLRQKTVATWLLEKFFNDETLDAWKVPNGGARTEVWVRPSWNAKKMFPNLFDAPKAEPKPAPSTGELHGIKEPIELADTDCNADNQDFRVSFAPRTKWRFFGKDGREVKRGFPTRETATEAMREYKRGLAAS